MSLAKFEAHLVQQASGFRCYACGDRKEKATFLARVKNHLKPPADQSALYTIDKLLGAAGTKIKQFYAKHDGVLMYEDTLWSRWSGGDYKTAGIAFFPVDEWQEKSYEMRKGWPLEDMPVWLQEGIAFGEIPHSANYFVIQPRGTNAGKVFYRDHDDFREKPIAGSFTAFLNSILADPADFLNRLGCYTLYTDGKTDIQWIPKEYVTG
jgi:hypothetical protein